MNISKYISTLRKVAFFLFLFPTLALFLSLIFHNFLATKPYKYHQTFSDFVKDEPGNTYVLNCNKENNFCLEKRLIDSVVKENKTLDECYVHSTSMSYLTKNDPKVKFHNYFSFDNSLKPSVNKELVNENFIVTFKTEETINKYCIKNYKILYEIYKVFPTIIEAKAKLIQKDVRLVTGEAMNPFIYGETSISNLVKRFPINYIFKPLVYLGVLLMFLYWSYYNKIFQNIKKEFNIFYIFGILSAIFLFFHVLFLGTSIKTELFSNIRRIIIVLFILFELLAQIFLTKKIFELRNTINLFTNLKIVFLKVFFVTAVIIITFLVLIILSIFNLPSKIDYILEWNYFLFLLFFYLLSFLMWKKQN